MGKARKKDFPLMSLPKPALQAVVDAVRDAGQSRGGELKGLRGTCRALRAHANAATRRVSVAARAALRA